MTDRSRDVSLMRAALRLALHGPVVDPNPRVGAVVTDAAGQVVGHGYHCGAGTDHAEVMALANAGTAAYGGTAVVTLEPCGHSGRTEACARALIRAGVARVVYAQSDPNPDAAGGASTLGAAGIEVRGGVLAQEAGALNPDWTFAVTYGRPRVIWKFASTLDGRSAAPDGTSQWITGPEARADVHRLRARAGAIVVGTATALADDPQLTVRDHAGDPVARQPLRVIVGRRALPKTARVLDDAAPTVHLRTHDPAAVLSTLNERGIRQVWLEGGATLAAAFLTADLVDEVVAYLALTLLGGGRNAVGDLGISTLADALHLQPYDTITLGTDLRVRAMIDTIRKAA